ncbi:MAG: hypothetical protein V5B39_19640, partial [Accumulibacter sp.]|uniref:hypothetical protein n=1 Tax=Accumulibacter sp. TaxID=2053492 RepID=UPI002FC30BCE
VNMPSPVRFQFSCLVHLVLLSKTWRLLHLSAVLQVDRLHAYDLSGSEEERDEVDRVCHPTNRAKFGQDFTDIFVKLLRGPGFERSSP